MIRYLSQLFNGDGGLGGWIQLAFVLAVFVFQIWMLVDALRRGEYIWAVIIFLFSGLSALLYFFLVYRASGGGNPMAGFELPGAADRRQIKRLLGPVNTN